MFPYVHGFRSVLCVLLFSLVGLGFLLNSNALAQNGSGELIVDAYTGPGFCKVAVSDGTLTIVKEAKEKDTKWVSDPSLSCELKVDSRAVLDCKVSAESLALIKDRLHARCKVTEQPQPGSPPPKFAEPGEVFFHAAINNANKLHNTDFTSHTFNWFTILEKGTYVISVDWGCSQHKGQRTESVCQVGKRTLAAVLEFFGEVPNGDGNI